MIQSGMANTYTKIYSILTWIILSNLSSSLGATSTTSLSTSTPTVEPNSDDQLLSQMRKMARPIVRSNHATTVSNHDLSKSTATSKLHWNGSDFLSQFYEMVGNAENSTSKTSRADMDGLGNDLFSQMCNMGGPTRYSTISMSTTPFNENDFLAQMRKMARPTMRPTSSTPQGQQAELNDFEKNLISEIFKMAKEMDNSTQGTSRADFDGTDSDFLSRLCKTDRRMQYSTIPMGELNDNEFLAQMRRMARPTMKPTNLTTKSEMDKFFLSQLQKMAKPKPIAKPETSNFKSKVYIHDLSQLVRIKDRRTSTMDPNDAAATTKSYEEWFSQMMIKVTETPTIGTTPKSTTFESHDKVYSRIMMKVAATASDNVTTRSTKKGEYWRFHTMRTGRTPNASFLATLETMSTYPYDERKRHVEGYNQYMMPAEDFTWKWTTPKALTPKVDRGKFPLPVVDVVLPPEGDHKGTVIFLHGLAQHAQRWYPVFEKIREPYMKVICPTANRRPISWVYGLKMNAWFDFSGRQLPSDDEDVEGIKNATKYIQKLIQSEIDKGTPSERIMIGGFAQGGALALSAALSFPHRLAGIMALSSWIPMLIPFLTSLNKANRNIPILLCHGDKDPQVHYEIAKAADCILRREASRNVDFVTFTNLQHAATEDVYKEMKTFMNITFKKLIRKNRGAIKTFT